MMKIAIDCRMINSSGVGTYLKEIIPYLTNDKSIYFLLIGNREEIKKHIIPRKNCEILECSLKKFTLREFLFFPIDIVNSCDVFFTPFINIPYGIKIPIFSTIHDLVFLDFPAATSFLKRIFFKLYIKRVWKKSHKIFTVSNFSKERIESHFGKTKEIITVYNGISSKIINEIAKIKKNNLFITKKNYIIYVGNIKKHKGLKTLIEAYIEGKKEGLNDDLYIVGSYEELLSKDDEAMNLIKKSNESIKFTGYIDDSSLINLIKEARLLVQPSFYEGFGIPPLEALALKTKPIISDIPVFKEIYNDFPVEFFKVSDSNDLKNKLLKTYEPIENLVIPEKYSYKESATIIRKILGEKL